MESTLALKTLAGATLIAASAALIEADATPPEFCTALTQVAAATHFAANGPLSSTPFPGATVVTVDPLYGYAATLASWPDDSSRTDMTARLRAATENVANCLPGWALDSLAPRDDVIDGSSFTREQRTVDVQIRAERGGGQTLRVVVRAPGGFRAKTMTQASIDEWLAAPLEPTPEPAPAPRTICDVLDLVLASPSVDALKGKRTDGTTMELQNPDWTERRVDMTATWTAAVPMPGATLTTVQELYGERFFQAVFAEWTIADAPTSVQVQEAVDTLNGLATEVGLCLSPMEWRQELLPPAQGSLGVVVFSRDGTEVRVTGLLSEETITAELRVRPLAP